MLVYRPHHEKRANMFEVYNEYCFMLLGYHLFLLTDYNESAKAKLMTGWSMVILSLANLLVPNLFMVI